MKKITLLLFGLYFTNLHAQLPTVQQYQTQQSNAWQTSLSALTSNGGYAADLEMLYDKVTPFAGLYTYNDSDNNIAKASLFKQALSELYRTSGQLKFESSESLENRLNAQQNYSTVIKMGIINTPISYLNYNSEFPNDGGVKLINGVYVAANNLPPFIKKQVTMISPLEELVFSNDNSITYQFNTSEVYQWGNKKIASMTADFGNGVTYTLIQNELWVQNSIAINYTTIDENKKLIFNIIYTDSTTLTTYAGISIGQDTTANNRNARIASTSGLTDHISTIADSNGALGQLEYRIFYGDQNTNNVLKKPFIIVDGFDPGDKRRVMKEDCANNPKCIEANKDWGTKTYESISFLMKYNNGNSDLKTQLTALNYDVIIVNFPTYENNLGQIIDGGADDIFRNGRTVASFLQQINTDIQANGSTEKLVLVGPSMGGQITRYALAYMEKKQQETGNAIWNHNTRIYLSMDSPHQGATIPLATQGDLYFLGELMGKDDAKSKYRDVINSKAARQMLLTIAGSQSNFYNTDHDVYNQELISNGISGSKGYPVLNGIRKLAIANGSMSGVRNVNPSEKFYEIATFAKLRSILTFGIRIAKIPVFRLNNWFMPDKNSTSILLKNYSKEPEEAINWNLTNNLWQGSLDALPGGNYNSANDLKDEVYNSLKETNGFTSPYGLFPLLWTGEKLIVEQRIPYSIDIAIAPQAFIPTHSALDTSGFSDWYQPIDRNLVCTGQTPFDSYYGENTNMGHITFTDTMVNWLLKELGNSSSSSAPQAPVFPLQENSLTGPSSICSETTFSFSDICKTPSAATWTVSPNLQIISSTGYSITVNQIWNSQGTITATFQNGQTLTKILQAPEINIATAEEDDICMQYNNYDGMVVYGAPSGVTFSDFNSAIPSEDGFIYYMPNGLNLNGVGHKYLFNIPRTLFGEQIFYNITYTNQCGELVTIPGVTPIIAYECSNYRTAATSDTFTIYPNPSNTTINVALMDENKAPAKKTLITGKLYDLNNIEKRKVIIKDNNAQIDASGLNRGVYILKIDMDGKSESHQVIVK
nr:T9SS type A sorting domain-containing protein [uncultured Flavobacterium sp.]